MGVVCGTLCGGVAPGTPAPEAPPSRGFDDPLAATCLVVGPPEKEGAAAASAAAAAKDQSSQGQPLSLQAQQGQPLSSQAQQGQGQQQGAEGGGSLIHTHRIRDSALVLTTEDVGPSTILAANHRISELMSQLALRDVDLAALHAENTQLRESVCVGGGATGAPAAVGSTLDDVGASSLAALTALRDQPSHGMLQKSWKAGHYSSWEGVRVVNGHVTGL